MPTLAENKKVFFEYEILETYEAGIILIGQEVKSIRLGHAQLAGSYVVVKGGEIWLVGATVPPYQPKNAPAEYDPQRPRKLLLQQSEINYLLGKAQQKGLTLVPIKMYTKHDKIKLAFGIAKGIKKRGKKELLKKRDVTREVHRELRARG